MNKKNYFSGLSKSTFLLALSSLFADISTEMLYPILPIFITQVIHAPVSIVGIVEGIATGTQYAIQGVSGYFSDKFKKRKPIAIFGFTLAALSKPAIGLAQTWPWVLAGRFFDRLGAGTRSAPRDALVASSADETHRGKAFGVEGFGDNLGAFLGPLIAAGLLYGGHINIRHIFFLTAIPGIIAIIMIMLVKEKTTLSRHSREGGNPEARSRIKSGMTIVSLGKFSTNYWKYIFVTALFGLGNASSAFLILRARQIGISLEATIFIYAFVNLVAALSSYPAGFLSDKIGRKNVLLFSFLIFAAVFGGFAINTNILFLAILFIIYGIYSGIFRAVGKTLATDFVSPELRASGVGWYATTIGLSGLVASIVAGQLWTNVSSQAAFLYATIFAVLGSISLIILIPRKTN